MIISINQVIGLSGYGFFVVTAVLAFGALIAWSIIFTRSPSIPKGLQRPPSPPGARLFSGHAHLWSGGVTNNPSQSQLVKWAREHGEIYEIRLGAERWVILSSPEAVKVGFLSETYNYRNSTLKSHLGSVRQAGRPHREQREAPSHGYPFRRISNAFHGISIPFPRQFPFH